MRSVKETLANMKTSFKIVGTRTCEHCGTEVKIIETSKGQVSRCLTCDDEQLKQQQIESIKQQKWRKAKAIFDKYSLIPPDIKKASFENYIPDDDPSKEDALQKAKWYANHFMDDEFKQKNFQSLFFRGLYGLGKSHLSYCISKAVAEKGYQSLFINIPDLMTAIKDTFNKESETTESEIMKIISDVDLLVLDDIGAEYVKVEDGRESWAADKLFQIMNSRIGKANVFTTNYTSADLVKKYGHHGGRLVSRMMQGTKPIKIQGDDWRLKQL
ncbi:ATP-binding protein [Tuberibacillus sp. Marseille-P3662]|uniref:ATP-binding protein n=1 Tax=Tuberibacillus sp. Marseille-P3662 TaxID=1965358 RepID=UPI0020CB3D14|nr:ATP-binding protein [Tuberibacillus sp. Marseille-P3662]